MDTPLYNLQRVSKRIGESDILSDVSLKVDRGEFLGITGESGAGKSTLLGIMGGLDRHTSGTLEFHGQVLELRNHAQSIAFRRRVGFVFQAFHLLPRLTVFDNVALPLRLRGTSEDEIRTKVWEVLHAVRLAGSDGNQGRPLPTRYPGEISRGQQQRVAIARALVVSPEVVLADEPTGSLDAASGADVLELLRSLNHDRGTTVVLVTHSSGALRVCQRSIVVRDGRTAD